MKAGAMTVALAFGTGIFSLASTATGDEGRERLTAALVARFQPAQIELQSGTRNHGAVRGGRLLVLRGGAVPAKPFRVIHADRTSPGFHVMDFARVDVGRHGRVRTGVEPLQVNPGDRLVVLDVKVTATEVRLQTHTAEPLRSVPADERVYGCTEFVFDVGAEIISAGNVAAILRRIEAVLEWTPAERVCAPENNQLCLQP